jgi:type IV pilus assembly protein PilV
MRDGVRGITLIEVLVAMTIFSVGVLGMLGVQARAISYFSDAKYRTDAALLADGLINDIWVNRGNMANYAYNGGAVPAVVKPWLNEVQAALPGGNAKITVTAATNTVQVTVLWQPPNAASQHQHVEIATIQDP